VAPVIDLTMAAAMTVLAVAAITGTSACRDGPCGIEKIVVPAVFAIPILVYTVAGLGGVRKVSRCRDARDQHPRR
jgi:hypothetical protein